MLQSIFFCVFCFVFAEYSGYRSTEFKVQALSGAFLQYGRDERKKEKEKEGWRGGRSSVFFRTDASNTQWWVSFSLISDHMFLTPHLTCCFCCCCSFHCSQQSETHHQVNEQNSFKLLKNKVSNNRNWEVPLKTTNLGFKIHSHRPPCRWPRQTSRAGFCCRSSPQGCPTSCTWETKRKRRAKIGISASCGQTDGAGRRRFFFAPGHGDARVQIVELGGAEGNLLVLLAVSGLHLQLHQLLLHPLNRLLLGLHGPARRERVKGQRVKRQEEKKKKPKQTIHHAAPNLSGENSLFGLFVFSYFGVGLGTLQLSLGIRQLIPFSINL